MKKSLLEKIYAIHSDNLDVGKAMKLILYDFQHSNYIIQYLKSLAPKYPIHYSVDLVNLPDSFYNTLEAFPQLTRLRLNGKKITKRVLDILGSMSQLQDLEILFDTDLTSLLQVESIQKLKGLRLVQCSIPDFEPLKKMTQLKALTISKCPNEIELADLLNLPNMNGLLELMIEDQDLSEADVKSLLHLSYLYKLDLDSCGIENYHLPYIGKLTNLMELSLSNNFIEDDGLHALQGLIKLQSLDLSRNELTDDGIKHLSFAKNMQTVYLYLNNISEQQRLRLKNLDSPVYIV